MKFLNFKEFNSFYFYLGIYDLVPLLKTDVNENLKMDLNEAKNCSPLAKFKKFSDEEMNNIEVLIVYGENESPSFKQQSEKYFDVRIFFLRIVFLFI